MIDTNNKPDILIDFSKPLKKLRHEEFAQLYVTSPFDVGVIYGEAGYKTSSRETDRKNAYKVLRLDAVRGRIAWLVEERNKRLSLDGDNVIRGLYMARDRCSGGKPVLDRQGKPVTITTEHGDMACLWRYDVAGFNRASELLAKFHGLLVERSINTNININEEKLEADADEMIKNINYSKSIKPSDRKGKTGKDGGAIPIPVTTDNAIDDTAKSDIVVYNEDGKVVA